MSAVHLALAMAAVGTVALAYCAHGLRAISRQEKQQQQRQQRIEDIETRAAVPAAPDNQPGINLDYRDECERLWKASQKEGQQ